MPSQSPSLKNKEKAILRDLGSKLRSRRKQLGVNATTTAEAAGMSRVTLYRIEKGEASVTIGAFIAAIQTLGLKLDLSDPSSNSSRDETKQPPQEIQINKYPQLKRLAWQMKATKKIKPEEALEIYERNWKHIDIEMLEANEMKLLQQLLHYFGRERLLV